MRLNRINSINFYGKIIDSHVHIGNWSENDKIRDYTNDVDVFIKSALDNGDTVEKVIVSNLDCMTYKGNYFISDEFHGNKRLLEFAQKNPKIAPLATCQPGHGKADNIKKLLTENPDIFVGFKFHPEQLNLAVSDSKYLEYMELAKNNNLPCLFHSARTFDVNYPDGGVGKASTLSNPEQIYELARKYKDVPVIMAHWGGNDKKNLDVTTKCIIDSIKKNDAKLYADISWVDCDNPEKTNLKRIIEQLKSENALDRILFGTDAPLGRFSAENADPKKVYEENIINIKNMIKREFPNDAEEIIDKVFYSNADNLFMKRTKPPIPQGEPKPPVKGGKNGFAYAIAGVVLLLSALGIYCYKKSQQSKSDFRA